METRTFKTARATPRYVVQQPIRGHFGEIDFSIRDIAASGIQIEHSEPLEPSSRARIDFQIDNAEFAVPGVVVWSAASRQSRSRLKKGSTIYRSGIKIENDAVRFGFLVDILNGLGRIGPATGSRRRRRRRLDTDESDS
jgi:PilZ domain